MSEVGYITEVHQYTYGSYLAANVSSGATSIGLQDASDFNEVGGQVKINGNVYAYKTVNWDVDTLVTLTPGLVSGASEDDRVDVYPLVTEKRAKVLLADSGETVECRVPTSMYDTIPEGIRSEDSRESVQLEFQAYEYTISDVTGGFNQEPDPENPDPENPDAPAPTPDGAPVTDGGRIDPITMPPPPTSDGLPPSTAPTNIAVQSGIQTLFVTWDPVMNEDPVSYDVYVGTVNPVTTGNATVAANVSGTLAVIPALGNGSALVYGTTYYAAVMAVDPDGTGPMSATASGSTISKITTTQISDDAITTPLLAANAVTAGELAANSVTAAALTGTLILGSRIIAGSSTGARAEMNGTQGLMAVNGSGDVTFQADPLGVVTVKGVVASTNYQEGEDGWYLSDQAVQFPAVNVLDSVGAGTVSTQDLNIDGKDLFTDIITPMPRGAIYSTSIMTGTDTAALTTSEQILFQFNAGLVKANRRYLILMTCHLAGGNTGDSYDLRLRFTTDGSTPTTGSTSMNSSATRQDVGSTSGGTMQVMSQWYSGGSDVVLKIALTGVRTSGSGTNAKIYLSEWPYAMTFDILDIGSSLSGYTNSWAQISKAAGVPDAQPPATYQKDYWSTTCASYIWDNTRRSTNADTYQGYASATYGTQKSMVNFDDAAIRADLAGATINGISCTFRVKGTYYMGNGTGMFVVIKQHNSSTPPTTYSGTGSTLWTSPGTYNPGQTVSAPLPVSFGNNLRDNLMKGIGFGVPPSTSANYYGYMYGVGTYRARLTINYTK